MNWRLADYAIVALGGLSFRLKKSFSRTKNAPGVAPAHE
jgi:hypothetical protein